MPIKYYTEKEWDALNHTNTLFANVLKDLGNNMSKALEDKKIEGGWNYIPLEISGVKDELLSTYNLIGRGFPKFLDVGCGIGLTLLLARGIGFSAHGIEVVPEVMEIAEKFMGQKADDKSYRPEDRRLFLQDALTFKDYKKFDVIYYYCPFENKDLQKKLEHLIENKMKVGAYLIANLKQDLTIRRDTRFKRIKMKGFVLWKKVRKKVKEVK